MYKTITGKDLSLGKSEVSDESISVCNVFENLVEHGTVWHASILFERRTLIHSVYCSRTNARVCTKAINNLKSWWNWWNDITKLCRNAYATSASCNKTALLFIC